jgi:signal transduction histidine kinase
VNVGPEQFRRILPDPILASIKFAPNKGLIRLKTCNGTPSAMIVRLGENRTGLEIKNVEPILSLFEQTDVPIRSRNGEPGLSLFVAKSLVQAHKGKLEGTKSEQKRRDNVF